MSKFKRWLYLKFLPDWCRFDLMDANQKLATTVQQQRSEISRLNAYIAGLENAMRAQRRISIRNEVKP